MEFPKFIEILKYFGLDESYTKVLTQDQIICIIRQYYSSIESPESYNLIQIEGLDLV